MKQTRVGIIWLNHEPAGGFTVETGRRTALLAIEEVLGEAARERAVIAPPEEALPLPSAVPKAPRQTRRAESPRARRHRRRTRRATRRLLITALTLGLALCIGALIGSGALNARDRYNARLIAAQQGAVEVYGPPEVLGHPGAAPSRQRSASIREFLGMASAF